MFIIRVYTVPERRTRGTGASLTVRGNESSLYGRGLQLPARIQLQGCMQQALAPPFVRTAI